MIFVGEYFIWIALLPRVQISIVVSQRYRRYIYIYIYKAVFVITDLSFKDFLFREESKEFIIWESGKSGTVLRHELL